MEETWTISEGDVLLATTRFLTQERKVWPYRFSVASGKDVDHSSIKEEIRKLFGPTGREPEFSGHGPDIVAVSEHEWWCIECKGTGKGKPSTQRNNFDRALASVVPYYEDNPQAPFRWAKDAQVFLGLALPASPEYLKELERRVRSPLRRRLNLRILLYEIAVIRAVAPTERF